jgi:hypothetical protein
MNRPLVAARSWPRISGSGPEAGMPNASAAFCENYARLANNSIVSRPTQAKSGNNSKHLYDGSSDRLSIAGYGFSLKR